MIGVQLFFLAFNLMEALLPSLISKESPAGYKGTAMGVYSTSQFLGVALGGSLGGWIDGAFDGQTAISCRSRTGDGMAGGGQYNERAALCQ
ncbi:major facilitator family transport protein [Salmonella bongori]|nr:major facilitator family transport protein [Salmonella bongori]